MLLDKYLPKYDFKEFHSVELYNTSGNVYQEMMNCDLSKSFVIRTLCRLRGIPSSVQSINQITKLGFVQLDEDPGKEIIFGMLTDSPRFSCCRAIQSPFDFLNISEENLIKAVINFKVEDQGFSNYIVSTETRVCCSSPRLKSKFKVYWFFVKPFSGLIRRCMLMQIKKNVASLNN